jgi:hypothetical protein
METEIRSYIVNYKVYWVTDNEGKRHLCHDPVYAQWLETKFKQEAKNADSGTRN